MIPKIFVLLQKCKLNTKPFFFPFFHAFSTSPIHVAIHATSHVANTMSYHCSCHRCHTCPTVAATTMSQPLTSSLPMTPPSLITLFPCLYHHRRYDYCPFPSSSRGGSLPSCSIHHKNHRALPSRSIVHRYLLLFDVVVTCSQQLRLIPFPVHRI